MDSAVSQLVPPLYWLVAVALFFSSTTTPSRTKNPVRHRMGSPRSRAPLDSFLIIILIATVANRHGAQFSHICCTRGRNCRHFSPAAPPAEMTHNGREFAWARACGHRVSHFSMQHAQNRTNGVRWRRILKHHQQNQPSPENSIKPNTTVSLRSGEEIGVSQRGVIRDFPPGMQTPLHPRADGPSDGPAMDQNILLVLLILPFPVVFFSSSFASVLFFPPGC